MLSSNKKSSGGDDDYAAAAAADDDNNATHTHTYSTTLKMSSAVETLICRRYLLLW